MRGQSRHTARRPDWSIPAALLDRPSFGARFVSCSLKLRRGWGWPCFAWQVVGPDGWPIGGVDVDDLTPDGRLRRVETQHDRRTTGVDSSRSYLRTWKHWPLGSHGMCGRRAACLGRGPRAPVPGARESDAVADYR